MRERKSVLEHLADLLESIEADLMLPLRAHEKENRGGFLSISRQVFCYIDYLGALSNLTKGKRTDKAIAYMKTYLVQTNGAYSDKCELMYNMWRHGTVHEYDALIFESRRKQFRLLWGANNTSGSQNRKWHLACLCMEGEPNSYWWFINLFELVEDLRDSIKLLIHDLEFDESRLSKTRASYQRLSKDYDLDQNLRLLEPAETVIGLPVGVIDHHGNVTIEFEPGEFEAYKKEHWGG